MPDHAKCYLTSCLICGREAVYVPTHHTIACGFCGEDIIYQTGPNYPPPAPLALPASPGVKTMMLVAMIENREVGVVLEVRHTFPQAEAAVNSIRYQVQAWARTEAGRQAYEASDQDFNWADLAAELGHDGFLGKVPGVVSIRRIDGQEWLEVDHDEQLMACVEWDAEAAVKQTATCLVHCPECNGTNTREVKTDGGYECLNCDRADHESWFGVWHSGDGEPYQPGVDGWDEADPPPGLLAS